MRSRQVAHGHRYRALKPLKLLSLTDIADVLENLKCCTRFCTKQFTLADMQRIRAPFANAKNADSRKAILIANLAAQLPAHRACYDYELEHKTVCQKAYAALQGFSVGTVANAVKLAIAGQSVPPHAHVQNRSAERSACICAWLQQICDHDCDRFGEHGYSLPDYLPTYRELWHRYQAEHDKEQHVSEDYFCKVRAEFFKGLVPRRCDDFAHCDHCQFLRQQASASGNPDDRAYWTVQLEAHAAARRAERVLEHKTELQAHNAEAVHIMCDGSKSLHLPWQRQNPAVSSIMMTLPHSDSLCVAGCDPALWAPC